MSASPARRGWPIGLVALVVLVVLAIGGVIYGATNRPDFDVFLYDAGPIEDYEDGEVRYLPQVNVYVVVLDDDGAAKQLRALDGIAPAPAARSASTPTTHAEATATPRASPARSAIRARRPSGT